MDLKKPFYVVIFLTILTTVFSISSPRNHNDYSNTDLMKQQIKIEINTLLRDIKTIQQKSSLNNNGELIESLKETHIRLDRTLDKIQTLVQSAERLEMIELYCNARISQHEFNTAINNYRTIAAIGFLEDGANSAKSTLKKLK